MMTNPTESDVRDQAIKAMIADPKARQHEIVAENEPNIDYSGSPIVSGDANRYLKAGQRLPELISVQRTDGQPCRLYEVAHRAGHTLILLAGPAADASALADLHATLQGVAANSPLFEAAVGFGSNRDLPARIGYLEPAAANLLGAEGLTLAISACGQIETTWASFSATGPRACRTPMRCRPLGVCAMLYVQL